MWRNLRLVMTPQYIHYARLVQLSCPRGHVEEKPFSGRATFLINPNKNDKHWFCIPSLHIILLQFLIPDTFMLPLKLNDIATLKRCYKWSLSPSHMPIMEDMDMFGGTACCLCCYRLVSSNANFSHIRSINQWFILYLLHFSFSYWLKC